MDKEEIENRKIKTYWWNCGKKTKDFEGTYKEFLKLKEITIEEVIHPTRKHEKGTRFKIPLYSTIVTIDFFGPDNEGIYINVIKTFLTLLGDKAKLITPRGEYNIN
jgi:hypothetical protein